MSQEKNWVKQPKTDVSNYNPIWKPTQEGDIIEGELIKVQPNVGPNNQWVYEIRVADGMVFTVWGKTALDGLLNGVLVNSYIKIEFLGKKKTQKGNTFFDFDVSVAQEQAPAPKPDIAASDPALQNQPPASVEASPPLVTTEGQSSIISSVPLPTSVEAQPNAGPPADLPVNSQQATDAGDLPIVTEEGDGLPF